MRQVILSSTARRVLSLSLLALAVSSCDREPPTAPTLDIPVFSGKFELRGVDGTPLPASAAMMNGSPMLVQRGLLRLYPEGLIIEHTGHVEGAGATNPVLLDQRSTYTGVAPDSFRTPIGISGRVWGDSAEVSTSHSTVFGAHRWLYVRKAGA